MNYKRNIRFQLEAALKFSPVILLTGARQAGKSTLVQQIAAQRDTYVTFDSLEAFSSAKKDPVNFINQLTKPAIIDEVQRIPEIFLPIKKDVDENRVPGRYILTGSANPLLIPRLGDSLAGRMNILHLYPLSQGELHNTMEHFIDSVFSDNPINTLKPQVLSKADLYKKIIVGGYPSVQSLPDQERISWFDSYITTILYRDVQDLSQVASLIEFPQLLRLLATRSGGLLNIAEISRASGIANTTLNRYLALLQILFMVRLQQPWFVNLGKRLVKSPKLYFGDTGLLANLLNIHNVERALNEPILMGGVLENFVVAELIKQASWSQTRVNIFHYRTVSGSEVDIVLEDYSGNVVGIEVKTSAMVTEQDFKGLRQLQEDLGDKFVKGIVLYCGQNILPFGDKMFVMPISALWSE